MAAARDAQKRGQRGAVRDRRDELNQNFTEFARAMDAIVDPVEDFLPECSNCFGDGYIEDEFGRIKFCQCEPKLRQKVQSAIAPAKISLDADQNPLLTDLTLSDRFVARYSPPQSETLRYEIADGYKVDTDGQLSLFDVQVVIEPEPPDPDDFESLDAFREAIALWDSEHNEPLEVSLDSFCEWAPCPADWYEPVPLLEPSEVSELSPAAPQSSSTSDFFIPTFDRLGDRFNRSDEPPDTGIFARLPKPKPPTFPPQVSLSQPQVSLSQPQVSSIQFKSIRHSETIPKLFHRIAVGSSTQPARSPPGGDAGF